MEYKLVVSLSEPMFVMDVNYAISEGWTPIGGIQIVVLPSSDFLRFYQAMVKPEYADAFKQTKPGGVL